MQALSGHCPVRALQETPSSTPAPASWTRGLLCIMTVAHVALQEGKKHGTKTSIVHLKFSGHQSSCSSGRGCFSLSTPPWAPVPLLHMVAQPGVRVACTRPWEDELASRRRLEQSRSPSQAKHTGTTPAWRLQVSARPAQNTKPPFHQKAPESCSSACYSWPAWQG